MMQLPASFQFAAVDLDSIALLASAIEETSIEPASPGIMLLFAAIMMATYVGVSRARVKQVLRRLESEQEEKYA